MTTLNWIDCAIVIIIVLSALISLIRGFVREALSLATWIIAFWVALTFSSVLETHFKDYIQSDSLRYAAAFIILFLVILIIGAIINFIITQFIEKTGLSGTDRLLGVVFGFARGVLLISIILLAARLTAIPKEPVWTQSRLVPVFTPIEKWLSTYIPEDIQNKFPGGKALLQTPDAVAERMGVIRKATNDSNMMNAATAATATSPVTTTATGVS